MKLSEDRTKLMLILVEAIVLVALLVVALLGQLGIIDRSATSTAASPAAQTEADTQLAQMNAQDSAEDTAEAEPVAETYAFDVEATLASMTNEQKIAQLVLCTPETLTRTNRVTSAGDATKSAIAAAPVGALLYSRNNYVDDDQIQELLNNTQTYMNESTPVGAYYMVASPDGSVNVYVSAADAAEVITALAGQEDNGEEIDPVMTEATVDTGSIYETILKNVTGTSAVTINGATMIAATGNVKTLVDSVSYSLSDGTITQEMLDAAVTEILEAKARQ